MNSAWRPRGGVTVAQRRLAMLGEARAFFTERGVLEVDVPMLSSAAVSDVNIESFEVRSALAPDNARYLHTSPEFAMKRMLAAGFPDIVSIGRVFRDGEAGQRHQPEFTMIEWYRHSYGLAEMQQETVEFVFRLLDRRSLSPDVVTLTYAEAFRQACGIDIETAGIDTFSACADADRTLRESIGNDRDAWMDLVMATRVAPQFASDRLTAITQYPRSQAALARISPIDSRYADRFELYLATSELANGYVELTDANEMKRRMEADQSLRRQRGLPLRPVDRQLLSAMREGLPECAGVAVGFDRLLMLNLYIDDIRDVQHFPWDHD